MGHWIAEWLIEPIDELKGQWMRIIQLIWGVMFSYFPTYAYLSGWLAWACYFIGLTFCLLVIIPAIPEIKSLGSNKLFRSIVRVVCLLVFMVACHAEGMYFDTYFGDGNGWFFKGVALLCAILALPSVVVCFQDFYVSPEKKKLLRETFALKNVVPFASAMMAFLTILIPFLQMVLSLTLLKH